MFSLIATFVVFLLWVGSTIAIIKIDAHRQRAAAQARGEVDFFDRSVTPYLVFAFIAGPLPIIFYFGTTRKGAKGWLMGLALCAADVVAVSIVGGVILAIAKRLDGS